MVIFTSLIVLVLIILLLTRQLKAKKDEEGKIKISYGIWFSVLFLSGSSILTSIITISLEAISNIYKMQPKSLIGELVRTLGSVILLAFVWYFVWFFIIKLLVKIIYNANDEQEMDNDSYGYFLIKGVVLLGTIFSLSPILELLLRTVVPTIAIPFYH